MLEQIISVLFNISQTLAKIYLEKTGTERDQSENVYSGTKQTLHFRDEMYGDVKKYGCNMQGRIIRGRTCGDVSY
jgi:hypothetical protein